MNLRVFEERTSRSKSPKRYSLNRKIKERESVSSGSIRKQIYSHEFGTQPLPPFSSRVRIPDSNPESANELPCYEMKRDIAMRNVIMSSQLPVQATCTEKKNNWAMCRPMQQPNSQMIPCSPGDFNNIASQLSNTPRLRPETQVPYTHYTPRYASHFGNFQGIQTLQSQTPLQNGLGHMSMPQGNPFVQSYMTPIQPGCHYSQVDMQNNEAYNAFTAYGNPFGIVWRPN